MADNMLQFSTIGFITRDRAWYYFIFQPSLRWLTADDKISKCHLITIFTYILAYYIVFKFLEIQEYTIYTLGTTPEL